MFELNFQLPGLNGYQYTALLSLQQDDDLSFVRVTWYDSLRRKVTGDFELNRQLGVTPYYDAAEPYFTREWQLFSPVNGQVEYAVDDLPIWTKMEDGQTGKEIPASSPDGTFRLTKLKTLTPASLTRHYLLRFFTAAELGLRERTFTAEELNAIRLRDLPAIHAIYLIDDKDSSIGKTCETDLRRVNGFYRKVANYLHLRYVKTELRSNNFTVQALIKTLSSVQPGPNDIVVFYYSGHGFRYRNDEDRHYPEMRLLHQDARKKKELRENSINTEQIFDMIRRKNARLNFVISDCCNSYVEMNRYEDTLSPRQMKFPKTKGWQLRTLYDLFVNARGSYLVSATRKGQLAGASDRGGFFTEALYFNCLEIGFRKRGRSYDNWSQVFNRAKGAASSLAARLKCPEADCVSRQRGIAKGCPYVDCRQDMIFKEIK